MGDAWGAAPQSTHHHPGPTGPPHNAGSVEQGHMHAWIIPRRSRPPVTIDIEKLQRADTRGLISCLAAPGPLFLLSQRLRTCGVDLIVSRQA